MGLMLGARRSIHAKDVADRLRAFCQAALNANPFESATFRASRAHADARTAIEHDARVQDLERRRIASELHDSAGQHLVGGSLALGRLSRLQSSSGGLNAAASEALQDAMSCIGEAQREIRLLTYMLHPPPLEQDGLGEALRCFVNGFVRRSGMECGLSVARDLDDIHPAVQHCLFRVVQEALINIHRHAGASRAGVTIKRECGQVTLEVSDNGHGARTATQELDVGVGIAGMRERVHSLGGALEFLDSPAGVTIRAILPLNLL